MCSVPKVRTKYSILTEQMGKGEKSMRHQMKLYTQPFTMIQFGEKTIELRLYDEKRQKIQVNDEIEFSCVDGSQKPFLVKVIALHRFDSFAALYDALPLLKCGYTDTTIAEARAEDMNQYYTPQEQARYGVVGIEIQLVHSDEDDLLRAD